MSFGLPKISKALWGAAALAVLLGGAVTAKVALSDDAAGYPAASAAPLPTDQAALIARGKYLSDAADCMPCHSGPNHAPYSGGLVLATPFGGLASPNITADKETGIGNWSDKDFWNALHYGTSPGRSYLIFPKFIYPAMPYTSYTKLSYQDAMAIKAYLFSLPPVKVAPTPSTMMFPFNQRPVLLGWRLLFFRAGAMTMDPSWNEHIKNGAYLTEALGHCGECHTPRNIMSGLIADESLAGAPIESYFAPNISSDKTYGVGGWSQDDLVAYLYAGGNAKKGSAYGPMGEVVQYSMSQIPKSDVQDIAAYLQTITPARSTPPSAGTPDALAAAKANGAKVYAANCAACHQAAGTGLMTLIPGLAGNGSVTAAQPYNVIGAVLNGLGPWNHGPAMPSFAASLSDTDISDVANYVRTMWGNDGTANTTPAEVKRLRAIAVVPPMASASADEFGCPHISTAATDTALTNPGGGLMGMFDGATPETLPNRTRAMVSALKASDATMSSITITNYLVAAYCPVVANTSGLSHDQKQAALENFIAGAQGLINAPAPIAKAN
ncbi:MAG: cytochrome c [Acidocella sp.]|nr:cytochrome c [Acidocella sp.]